MRSRFFFLACFALLLPVAATAQKPASLPAVEYELGFGRPNLHLLEITIRARGLNGTTADFAMPAWSPGWYVINNYAKMVQEFAASGGNGKPLRWRKTDKQTWRVELGGATAATVQYKLYGNTLDVGWMQYNDQHAHVAGPATWMYLVGGKQRPTRLKINTPQGWRVATGMPRTAENAFAAEDYDRFIDYPLEISDFTEQTFTSGGTTYHIVVHDILGKKDYTQFTRDTQKAVEDLVAMMKPVAASGERAAPFESYWFLFHIWPNAGGGLEHLNSTQIMLPGDWAIPAAGEPVGGAYRGQMGVTVHEFFHAYNVKRMRPKPLGPFDYSREAHTPSLWISEGLTNYFEAMALLRAGLVTPEDHLTTLGQVITGFESSQGRAERSIEDTSWDTWFWYTGDSGVQTNRANVDQDYYAGGEILGHFLDFAIRNATQNKKSLDDWMRLMYTRYALPKPGFTPEQAIRAVNEVAGRDLSGFFRRHISGKEPLPYEEYFGYAGILAEKKTNPNRGWFGATINQGPNGEPLITSIRSSGPALEAGLSAGDVIKAVGGEAVSLEKFIPLLRSKKPGDVLQLTVQRLGKTQEFTLRLGNHPGLEYTLTLNPQASAAQRAMYQSWSGRP